MSRSWVPARTANATTSANAISRMLNDQFPNNGKAPTLQSRIVTAYSKLNQKEMVRKEVWIHLLAYNLIRGVMAKAAFAHDLRPRQLSFKGASQTMTAFQEALRRATPGERDRLVREMLKAIACHRVGDRPGRVEPRANKRRPKPQKFLMEPRQQARKRLMRAA